ncbi:MAG: T9SS type A sorting domain-containing protein [Dysgonamonadaceae bacterium]|jgi:hypothetical protein|nr:T9SS type A sorting domain-containing protein [Dysgonamonadaceae bacterium]
MKRILIFTVLLSLGLGAFAQEYYTWYRGEKQAKILDPTRKYISVHSADDTLALKNRLIEQNIQVPPFIKDGRISENNYRFYGVIVESDHFPDFSEDKTIAYEGGYFLHGEGVKFFAYGSRCGALAEPFWVRLKNSDDFPKLKAFAEENNVTIAGRDRYMPAWYYLYCTKASKGNSMQLGNLCYESGLCDAADIGFTDYGSDALSGTIHELDHEFELDPDFNPDTNPIAQEYYRWYQGEKEPLILDPTRKFIWIRSADDTLVIKNRLIEQNIYVHSFVVMRGALHHCWAIIESDEREHFPNFTENEMIVYEGGYFLYADGRPRGEGGLDPVFAVKLKNSDDFPELKKFAKENNVTIMGRDIYMASWYYLFCTKASKGDPMQMANQLYASGLYDAAEIGLASYGSDAFPGNNYELDPDFDPASPMGIVQPAAKPAINLYRESGSSIAIDAAGDLINEVEVFDMSGKILHQSSYSGVSRANWKANQKGLYLLKIKLQSGNRVYRKIVV